MSVALDGQLVPLVCFLFLGGWFFLNSLVAGLYTTRVVARIVSRNGCCETVVAAGRKASVGVRRKRPQRFLVPAPVRLGLAWVRSFGSVVRDSSFRERTQKQTFKTKAEEISFMEEARTEVAPPARQWAAWQVAAFQSWIPYRFLSHVWGVVTRIPLVLYVCKYAVYMLWTVMYDCKLDEMEAPLASYASLSEFFLRGLRPGMRPVDAQTPGAMVSPVDGKILHVGSADVGELSSVLLEQVKGVTYSLQEFVGPFPDGFPRKEWAAGMKGAAPTSSDRKLQTIVLYLAPGDYHHFHSPVEWEITQQRHFPGNLMPVRPWAVEQVPGLYCQNERVALNGTWEQGYFGMVAVGALNVGSIDLACDPELRTNLESSWPFQRPTQSLPFAEKSHKAAPFAAVRGQRLGDFNLGSTIVLVFETSKDFDFNVKPGQTVKVGERIGFSPVDAHAEQQETHMPVMCPPWPCAVAAAAAAAAAPSEGLEAV